MRIMHNKQSLWQTRVVTIGCAVILLAAALTVTSSYRGMFHGDSVDYFYRADTIFYEHRVHPGVQSISSVLHPLLIALSYPLVGHTLLASHLFQWVLAALTPLGIFGLLKRLLGHTLWAFLGAVLFLCYPANFIWLNQNSTESVFVFWVVAALLCAEYAKTRPALLVGVGVALSCSILARFFDGLILSGAVGLALGYEFRRKFPWKWFGIGLAAFVGIQVITAMLLNYSLIELARNYFIVIEAHDQQVTQSTARPGMTTTLMAIAIYLRWYFGGKFAPLVVGIFLLGIASTSRRNHLTSIVYFVGYSSFLLLVLGGREIDVYLLRLAVKVIPALCILLTCGSKTLYDWLRRVLPRKTAWIALLGMTMYWLLLGLWAVRMNQRFLPIIEDISPSASLWQIVRHNPEYPIFYEGEGEDIREELFKDVLGRYRPSYRSKRAQIAWDAHEPQQARERADFAYYDTFTDGERWKAEAFAVSGNSALWSAAHPEHLGAFPYGAEGTVIYKFSFPRKVHQIVLSDIHTQWTPGDVVRLWTSPDGNNWTLRYDDHQLRYQKTYYHETLTADLAGSPTCYLKYYFRAGDASRKPDDNRGASLEELSVAVTFERE